MVDGWHIDLDDLQLKFEGCAKWWAPNSIMTMHMSKLLPSIVGVLVDTEGRFRLQWRSAMVGLKNFSSKTRLFETTIGMVDKMEKQ